MVVTINKGAEVPPFAGKMMSMALTLFILLDEINQFKKSILGLFDSRFNMPSQIYIT